MPIHARYGNTELLSIAESVAREKSIPKETVLEAIEQAILVASRRKYGHDIMLHAQIDPKTGQVVLSRERTVVEIVENNAVEISLPEAQRFRADAAIGDTITEPLPPIDLGRVAASSAKQVIIHKVRDAEREREYKEYHSKIGDIVMGTAKRVEYGSVTIDLGRAEGYLARDQMIRTETIHQGDRVRAYIMDVRQELRGPQIFLSRTDPRFLAQLFAQEVPEIYDGIIQVKAVAREPGVRAKMAVYSNDGGIDPVGSCVGVRGSRVQTVINELQGEKIDIVPWSSDPATFVINALAPASITKVVIDEEKRRIEVVVATDQLSLAIGRRGQNVRLAAQLTGWAIDVLTEDEESKRRLQEFTGASDLFMKALDVEDVLAHLLVSEGFTSVEELAHCDIRDLTAINAIEEALAVEIKDRATAYLTEHKAKLKTAWSAQGIDPRLAELPHMNEKIVTFLGSVGIKTLDDLADLSRDEMLEMLPKDQLTDDQIDAIIMGARDIIFNTQ